MINKFTKVDDLNKVLRKYLIKQSQLPNKRVLNTLSTYGDTLDKFLNCTEVNSYELSDVVLLFELISRNNDSDISFTEDDLNDSITYNKSYTLKLILYGNNSSDVANKIVARFRTEKVRNSLYEEGVYIEKIEDPVSFNEFKNKVMWPRNDINILISCEFSFSQIEEDLNMNNLSKIQIIKA